MSLQSLQEEWNELYKKTLPSLARAKDPAQSRWPVNLDHCFGRIILDNVVGETKPWTEVLKSPAYKNMSKKQLQQAIELGREIAAGDANLVALDERSLQLRGKESKNRGSKRKAPESGGGVTKSSNSRSPVQDHDDCRRDGGEDVKSERPFSPLSKRTRNGTETISSYFQPDRSGSKTTTKGPSGTPKAVKEDELVDPTPKVETEAQQQEDPLPPLSPLNDASRANTFDHSSDPLDLIHNSNTLTPFRKQILTLLCQVPAGSYTTYGALSDHVSATTHKTCARAVGSAMRNNPFAPVVPCHRVLANDGKIGGFGGHWGEDGKFAGKKREMLRREGVKFDGKGKVVGGPFRGFK